MQLDGSKYELASTGQFLASIELVGLQLGTCWYTKKTLKCVLGRLQWALHSGCGGGWGCFLATVYAWLHYGPEMAKSHAAQHLQGGQQRAVAVNAAAVAAANAAAVAAAVAAAKHACAVCLPANTVCDRHQNSCMPHDGPCPMRGTKAKPFSRPGGF